MKCTFWSGGIHLIRSIATCQLGTVSLFARAGRGFCNWRNSGIVWARFQLTIVAGPPKGWSKPQRWVIVGC